MFSWSTFVLLSVLQLFLGDIDIATAQLTPTHCVAKIRNAGTANRANRHVTTQFRQRVLRDSYLLPFRTPISQGNIHCT